MSPYNKHRLRAVPLAKMRVREGISQREFRPAWALQIAKEFDPDKLTPPIVNHHANTYWIIDGQHRVAAVKQFLGTAWETQSIECWVFDDMSEAEEAERFLGLNTTRSVSAYDKFRVALTARHEEETNINAIVQKHRLAVTSFRTNRSGSDPTRLTCVESLRKAYRRGPECLDRSLHIANEAFGGAGLTTEIIDGLSQLVARYDDRLDDDEAIQVLSTLRGGVSALRARANQLRLQTGVRRGQCIAAATVEAINKRRRGRRMPGWWKSEEA